MLPYKPFTAGNAKAAELKKEIYRIASEYNKKHTNISGQTSDEQKLRMEAVAEAFEMWLYEDRKAGQDTEADRLFKEIQDFFRKIYDCLKSISGVRLDPDTDAFFRKICGLDDIALTEYMRAAEQQGTRLYQAPIVDEVNIKTDVPILDLSNIQRKIKTKKDLKAFIQQLIDEATAKNSSASAETRDGHKVQLADKVKTKNHGTYKVAQHIAYSSNKMQPKQREFIVSNIYDLIEYSFFVDEAIEKKDKIGYDKVYRYYVPVCLNSNTVYTVRIDKKYGSRLQGRANTPGLPAARAAGTATDTISIADLLRNVKDSDGFPYIQNDDEIRIDGKYVHMKNSEGNYIASTVKDLRNFYKWFGDSNAVEK